MVVLIDPDLGWLKYIDGGPDRSGFRLAIDVSKVPADMIFFLYEHVLYILLAI